MSRVLTFHTNVTRLPENKAVEGQPSAEVVPFSLFNGLFRRLDWLKRLVPLGMLALVIVYELGPASWIRQAFGDANHFVAEIIFYGTIGPLLVYFALELLERWLAERETSDLQARVLMLAREQARKGDQYTDEALQALFAASMLISSLEAAQPDLPPELAAQMAATKKVLEQTIVRVSAYLRSKGDS